MESNVILIANKELKKNSERRTLAAQKTYDI
jgi:hypothetical protein